MYQPTTVSVCLNKNNPELLTEITKNLEQLKKTMIELKTYLRQQKSFKTNDNQKTSNI